MRTAGWLALLAGELAGAVAVNNMKLNQGLVFGASAALMALCLVSVIAVISRLSGKGR